MFNVIQIGDELRDPDDNALIGYDGVYAGEARTTRTGDPASLILVTTTREVLNGNRLLRDNQTLPLNFFPSEPAQQIDGSIISILDAISVTGSNQVVVINRGARHGNEEGNLKRHADDETLAAVKRLTSTGYVRGNNLYVLHGGAALAEAEEPVAAQASAAHALTGTGPAEAVAVGAAVATESVNAKLDRIREARMLGFEGDACDECGNFTLVRNGTCLKCNTCGATSGCS